MSNFNWLDDIGINDTDDIDSLEVPVLDEDRDKEWRKDRLGMITGSNFGKIVKKDRKGGYTLSNSKTASDLIYKIAWERLLRDGNISNGLGRLSFTSQATNHGNDYEGEAILKYIEITGRDVDYEQRFVRHDDFIGGTPDGYIGNDGIIEVKCPFNGGNHLKTLLTGEIYNEDYIYQIQGYLWVTGRKWCDFVTYDPDLIDGLQLSIIRVNRNDELIQSISEIMDQVKEQIQTIINNEKLK